MENNIDNQNTNTQSEYSSYNLDPYYNVDPYEKNPYYDQPPYPRYVRKKEPVRMMGQYAGVSYQNQMPPGGIVYPNGVSYEEYEARKKAYGAKSDADTALVLGIFSIIFSLTFFGGLGLGIPGICIAIRSGKKAEGHLLGTAIAGLICSIIGVLGACYIFFVI